MASPLLAMNENSPLTRERRSLVKAGSGEEDRDEAGERSSLRPTLEKGQLDYSNHLNTCNIPSRPRSGKHCRRAGAVVCYA